MIARSIAGTRKKATLELGGKAANIIFDDAAIDQAVEGIVNGIFFNQGHVCCAGSRLLVQESIADDVEKRLKRRLATLRVGDPLDKNTDVGAINSKAQLQRITELTAAGEAEGATRWEPECELPSKGFWFRPTVFTGVSQTHRIAQEEIFGPVLSVLTFRTARGGRQGQQHPLRPLSRRLDREGLPHPLDGRPAPGRRRLGQHLQQVRPGQPVRRLQGVARRAARRGRSSSPRRTDNRGVLVLRMAIGDFAYREAPFDQIADAVAEGRADAGLLIHEGQLTYEPRPRQVPRPRGVVAAGDRTPAPSRCRTRRDLDVERLADLSDVLRRSIEEGLANRARGHAVRARFWPRPRRRAGRPLRGDVRQRAHAAITARRGGRRSASCSAAGGARRLPRAGAGRLPWR